MNRLSVFDEVSFLFVRSVAQGARVRPEVEVDVVPMSA